MSIESDVYRVLTGGKYNRDKPYLTRKLMSECHYFISRNEPIKLIGFWGVGPKDKPNWADLATCEFLASLNGEIKHVYPPGIEFTFIFATLHGIHNGISMGCIARYTAGMGKVFAEFGFKSIYLDNLWKKYGISFGRIDAILKQKGSDWWKKVKNHNLIEYNARKRNQRLDPRPAAQRYYVMRNLEKEMLEKEFSDFIFHTFSDSRLRNVLPNLPTLYFRARKGWSDTPWFVTKPK